MSKDIIHRRHYKRISLLFIIITHREKFQWFNEWINHWIYCFNLYGNFPKESPFMPRLLNKFRNSKVKLVRFLRINYNLIFIETFQVKGLHQKYLWKYSKSLTISKTGRGIFSISWSKRKKQHYRASSSINNSSIMYSRRLVAFTRRVENKFRGKSARHGVTG